MRRGQSAARRNGASEHSTVGGPEERPMAPRERKKGRRSAWERGRERERDRERRKRPGRAGRERESASAENAGRAGRRWEFSKDRER